MDGKRLGPKNLYAREQELTICNYYWTRQSNGYYPSYKEVAATFNCSPGHIANLLKRHDFRQRTQAETREGRSCKPINQPIDPAPLCACGCGKSTEWISKESKWQKYAPGHYAGMERKRVQPTYIGRRGKGVSVGYFISRSAAHLYSEVGRQELTELYQDKHHTVREIAAIMNVGAVTVSFAMCYHGVALRSLSESLILRGSVSGSNNPAWKGGVAKWDYSSDWKRLCKQIKDRDKWTCQLCNEQRKRWGHKLHVHHIDEDKTNNDPHNLISLCSTCHAPIHGNQEIRPRLIAIAVANTA